MAGVTIPNKRNVFVFSQDLIFNTGKIFALSFIVMSFVASLAAADASVDLTQKIWRCLPFVRVLQGRPRSLYFLSFYF